MMMQDKHLDNIIRFFAHDKKDQLKGLLVVLCLNIGPFIDRISHSLGLLFISSTSGPTEICFHGFRRASMKFPQPATAYHMLLRG